ncbi:prolyl oligopeptidase family serine peptidase [Actinomadura rudentiformis]|uniref:prolyl oligopeptidase n=1 Tax=Actinomadura rudentiformis TaxID=359158 RepID=A0A6H9Y7I0_9ACTN|nr:prolyl oligopeptidase family serine peptidase [Actinomadura rudentiformis]KAB2339836.1 S9 family peptidase [Actinomadura rudentiformis]
MSHPPAERQPIVDDLHGHRVPDPYRWLEDPSSPQTNEWLAAQDELWQTAAGTLTARDELRARGATLVGTGMITAPMWRGDNRFFLRRAPGQEHAVLHVSAGDRPSRVLIDPTALDPTGLTTLDAWQPCQDGRLLAYQLSTGGTERAELYVMDVETGKVVEGPIDRCRYSPVAWLPDGRGFYYVRATVTSKEVHLHRLGTPADLDPVVFGADADGPVSYGLGISHDGRWLAVSAVPGTSPRNDLWLADLSSSRPEKPDFTPVQHDVNARSVLIVRGERMYVVTDHRAPRVRISVADPAKPTLQRELIAEDPEAVLTDFAILDGLDRPVLVVAWIRNAISEITVHDLATGEPLGDVPLPGPGSIGPLASRPEGGDTVWFTYTDTVTPEAVWSYDARTQETKLWEESPGKVDTPDVETRTHQTLSADGSPVHVTVIGPAGAEGPLPTILYGYGGFGVPLTPSYAADALAWVDAGGRLAIARLRGGGEQGLSSHRAGVLDRKQRVFDDFIAAAEMLISEELTTSDRLAIWGESNGGLLVGAALTQRPELFAAAVCVAPLLDMIRYERSGLGASWSGEYGSASKPEEFQWLYAYSPYHHVHQGVDYPAVLFTVFDGDTRVDPMHARKMCANLQWATSGSRPILFRREAGVGHGARAASRSLELAADMLAFAAAHTGLRT